MPFPTSLLTFSPPQFLSNLAFYLAFSVILSPPLAPSFSPFPLSASTIPHGLHPYRQAPFPSFLAAAMSWISPHLLLSTSLFIPKLPFGCTVQGAKVGMRGNRTHSSLNLSNVRSFLGLLVPFLGLLTAPLPHSFL